MYKICKTERSFARQRELEEGLLYFLDDVSFFEMEIADLCRRLSIPRKTFYRYFGSKEDALFALIDHRIADMNQYIAENSASGHDSTRDQALYFFTFWKQQRRFLDILQKNLLAGLITQRAVSLHIGSPFCDDSAEEQNHSTGAFISNFYISGIMSMMYQWYMTGFKTDIREIAELAGTLTDTPLCQLEFRLG